MWKRRREQKTHVLEVPREVLMPTWYRNGTSSLTSSRTKASLMTKESSMERTRPHSPPSSRRRLIRRKMLVMCAVILVIGLLLVPTALTSASMGRVARLLMLSWATLRRNMLGMVYYLLFFHYVILLIGGLTRALMYISVLIFPCFLHIRSEGLKPC